MEKQKRWHVYSFHFFFLVQKMLPQLHFVLIIKRCFVFIMTHRGSCHYQQTVLRYNSPSQPVCSHKLYPPTPPSIFIFCFLSTKHCENPSPLLQVISQLTNKTLFHNVWHSQNFLPTLEIPPFCLLVRCKLWRFLQREHLQVSLKPHAIQFIIQKTRAVWMNTTCEACVRYRYRHRQANRKSLLLCCYNPANPN